MKRRLFPGEGRMHLQHALGLIAFELVTVQPLLPQHRSCWSLCLQAMGPSGPETRFGPVLVGTQKHGKTVKHHMFIHFLV